MKYKIKNIYKEKENILTYIIILLVSVILCFNFIRFHTVPDTYCVLASEDYYSSVFFSNGRLATGAYLYIGNLLNIPVTSSSVRVFLLSLNVNE